MFLKSLNNLKRFDWILFSAVLILVGFGLMAIYSVALSRNDPDALEFLNFKKQIVFIALGIVFFFVFSITDYRLFRNYAKTIYLSGIILLIAVLAFGTEIRGTKGWFSFGSFNVQPIELVKVFLIFFLARYFSSLARPLNQISYLIISGITVGLYVLLITLQPDFGSALVLILIWAGLVVMIGLDKWQRALLIVLGISLFCVLWFFVFADFQKERIKIFLDPASEPLGGGYNVTQAIIAIGSGQSYGRGLGFGSQSQLKFLPESQTDFVFAVIAEELGFAGVGVLLVVIGVFLIRIIFIARSCKDDFSLFLVLQILILFFAQMFINIAMNLGMAPVTGITLPFVSYGGSSLIASMILVGILQSVRMRS